MTDSIQSPPLELVGCSPAVAKLREFLRRAATLDGGVLFAAEDGSDVDALAAELHARGRQAAGPFVSVDCATSGAAVERDLFGACEADGFDLEAVSCDSGIARARGGTMFLRHVTELPAGVQGRLARVARDGEVRVDGDIADTALRLVASAQPGVDGDVDTRRFRADLYRRLASIRIDVVPLRHRQEDVPALAMRLLDDVCRDRQIAARRFAPAAVALVGGLGWPGNIGELRDVIDRVVADSESDVIELEQLLPALRLQRGAEPFAPAGSLREARLRFERDYIASVLQHHGWHMAAAAQTLGIQRPNLYRKARQLGIPLTRTAE